MKDLYTFDYTSDYALETYKAVRMAYNNLFNELAVPYLVAEADSGNMGGKLSHEYHFASPKGEDNVWSCDTCNYVANEELVEKRAEENSPMGPRKPFVFTGISVDRKTRIDIYVPRPPSISDDTPSPSWTDAQSYVNLHAAKRYSQQLEVLVDIDTGIEASKIDALLPQTTSHISIYDRSTSPDSSVDITPIHPDAPCPRCPPHTGKLGACKAIEVAHTFHLGTRYSEPLNAVVALPDTTQQKHLEMGCHGIGVSRLIGAIASLLADSVGLNWPRVIAPFEVAVISTIHEEGAVQVYDSLQEGELNGMDGNVGLDAVLDDRPIKSLAWKLRDADLIGYPVLVVLGRAWKDKGMVEIQCRRLGVKRDIGLGELRKEVLDLLKQL